MIAGMTPEQVLALRKKFEDKLSKTMAVDFQLQDDGFSYRLDAVNEAWEWFVQGASVLNEELKATPSKTADDELRRMRQYSSCFTKAYDKKEPVFVLRAQDENSPRALAQWITSYQPILGDTHYKLIAAKATLGVFLNWPNKKKAD